MIPFELLRTPQVQSRFLNVNRSFSNIVYSSNLEYLWDILEWSFSHAIHHDDDRVDGENGVWQTRYCDIRPNSISQHLPNNYLGHFSDFKSRLQLSFVSIHANVLFVIILISTFRRRNPLRFSNFKFDLISTLHRVTPKFSVIGRYAVANSDTVNILVSKLSKEAPITLAPDVVRIRAATVG